MEEETQEELDSLNPDEETEPLNSEEDESPEVLKEKLLKAEELAKNQKIRAEKAESLAKQLKDKPAEKETPKNDMSLKDIRALGDVHDDDVDDVIDYAKFKGITVAEAKKSPTMQSLLKAKTEERKTAEVTNTGGSRGGSSKVSPETLIQNANKGKLPESDEGIDALMHAKLHGKKD